MPFAGVYDGAGAAFLFEIPLWSAASIIFFFLFFFSMLLCCGNWTGISQRATATPEDKRKLLLPNLVMGAYQGTDQDEDLAAFRRGFLQRYMVQRHLRAEAPSPMVENER